MAQTMESLPESARSPRRRDRRLPTAIALIVGIFVLGWVVTWIPGRSVIADRMAGRTDNPSAKPGSFSDLPADGAADRRAASEELVVLEPRIPPRDAAEAADRALLAQATKEIRAKRYDAALTMLDQARPRIQNYPESYLYVGRALEGKKDYASALAFYNAALDRDPTQAEAYWGMATSSEAMGDLETALGGMRSFLHTVADPDPYRLKVAQARSAIWEWEAKLGRGPWGPTKGIIPGLTPEQAAKNDKGAGIMITIPGTEKEDGSMKFEVKNQDRFELFKKK